MWQLISFCLPLCLAAVHQNGLSMNQMLMGLSPNVLPGPKEGDLAGHDVGHETKRIHIEKGNMNIIILLLSCKTSVVLVAKYYYNCNFNFLIGIFVFLI